MGCASSFAPPPIPTILHRQPQDFFTKDGGPSSTSLATTQHGSTFELSRKERERHRRKSTQAEYLGSLPPSLSPFLPLLPSSL